jgi:hypothetical protein
MLPYNIIAPHERQKTSTAFSAARSRLAPAFTAERLTGHGSSCSAGQSSNRKGLERIADCARVVDLPSHLLIQANKLAHVIADHKRQPRCGLA